MGVSGQRRVSAVLYPRYPLDVRLGGSQSWSGHGLEEKSFASVGDQTPVVQSVVGNYTDWATPAPRFKIVRNLFVLWTHAAGSDVDDFWRWPTWFESWLGDTIALCGVSPSFRQMSVDLLCHKVVMSSVYPCMIGMVFQVTVVCLENEQVRRTVSSSPRKQDFCLHNNAGSQPMLICTPNSPLTVIALSESFMSLLLVFICVTCS
jgi:hypothetical protein